MLAGNAVRVWDLRTGERLGDVRVDAGTSVECLALWPGRDDVVLGSGGAGAAPPLAVWQIVSGKRVGALLAGTDRKVAGVAFDPDGRHLAAVDSKGNLALWLFPRRLVKDAIWDSPPPHDPHWR